MSAYHLRIFPPTHPNGNALRWLWEIRSAGDTIECGTSDDAQEAVDLGMSALQELTQEETYEDDDLRKIARGDGPGLSSDEHADRNGVPRWH